MSPLSETEIINFDYPRYLKVIERLRGEKITIGKNTLMEGVGKDYLYIDLTTDTLESKESEVYIKALRDIELILGQCSEETLVRFVINEAFVEYKGAFVDDDRCIPIETESIRTTVRKLYSTKEIDKPTLTFYTEILGKHPSVLDYRFLTRTQVTDVSAVITALKVNLFTVRLSFNSIMNNI